MSTPKKGLKFARQSIEIAEFTLPNHDDSPTVSNELRALARIADSVPPQLRQPVSSIGLRLARAEAAVVAMPKAPMHEYHFAATRKHEVRTARQFRTMKAITIAETVDEAPHDHFGDGVLAAHAAHESAALRWSQSIDHLARISRKQPSREK